MDYIQYLKSEFIPKYYKKDMQHLGEDIKKRVIEKIDLSQIPRIEDNYEGYALFQHKKMIDSSVKEILEVFQADCDYKGFVELVRSLISFNATKEEEIHVYFEKEYFIIKDKGNMTLQGIKIENDMENEMVENLLIAAFLEYNPRKIVLHCEILKSIEIHLEDMFESRLVKA